MQFAAVCSNKQYDAEDLEAAVSAVLADTYNLSLAALIFNIPYSTLRDHVENARQGKFARGVGHPRQLSLADERGLVAWVQLRALLRFPVSKEDALLAAAKLAKHRGAPFRHANGTESDVPSDHWFGDFKRGHPGMKFRRGTKLKAAQAALTREDLNAAYDLLEQLRAQYGVQPCDIWNFDECGFDRAIGEKEKVLGPADMQRLQFFTKYQGHVTIGTAINAAGDRMDPLYIFMGSPLADHDKEAAEGMLAGLGADKPAICWTSMRRSRVVLF